MWKIKVDEPTVADPQLLDLDSECPTQLISDTGDIGLLVAVWCKRHSHPIEFNNKQGKISFGFTEGKISVHSNGMKIALDGRYNEIAFEKEISQSEHKLSQKSGGIKGSLGSALKGSLMSGAKAGVEVGLQGNNSKETSKNSRVNEDFTQPHYRLREYDRNTWLMNGIGLNDENVLDRRIPKGDAPLCYLQKVTSKANAAINVSVHFNTLDLWVDAHELAKHQRRFLRKPENSMSETKKAILTALVAKFVKSKCNPETLIKNEGDILVARQRITLSQSETE